MAIPIVDSVNGTIDVNRGESIMLLGENIKTLRLSRKLSQSQLSKALGKSNAMIGFYENGSRMPSYPTLIKLADYFDVSIDYLLGRKNHNKPAFDLDGLTDSQKEAVFLVIHEYRLANEK